MGVPTRSVGTRIISRPRKAVGVPPCTNQGLIPDAGRVVGKEVARAASGVVGIADLGRCGALRAVVGASLVVAVVSVSTIGQAASASPVASQAFGGVMTSVAQIDGLAAGGGANNAEHERAEEASLHGR